MNGLILALLVLLNVAISWWNCYAVGSVWREARGGFEKLLLYSAAIQSVAGFSVPILLALTWVATTILAGGDDPMPPEQIKAIWEGVMSLWYVAIIIPVVGSGFIIWGHSVREAWQRRDFASIGIAGWNTVAQVSNTASMFSNFGPALSNVGKLFKGDNAKNGAPLLVILLVVVALLSSVLLTVYLIQHYADKAATAVRRDKRAMA